MAKVGIKYDDIQVSDVSIIKKYITNMIENPEPQTVVGTAHFSAYIRYDIIYRSLAPFFKSISTPTGLYEFAPYIVEEDNYIYSINGDTLLVLLNEISITHDPISLVDRTADVTITDHTA